MRQIIPILLYHQIASVPAENDPKGLALSPEQFERQMSYLHRSGYQCLPLSEVVRALRKGLPLPRKSFVLTFDDGYRDLYSTVWPILDRFGFTATIFFVAGRVGHRSDWEGQQGPAAAPLLSWEEIRSLTSEGLTIGCHTLTHPRLTHLSNNQVLHEIRQSKVVIEEQLDVKVDLFSYPYHATNNRIQRIVAESDFAAACAGDRGRWGLFNLWRADSKRGENLISFALKVSGLYYRLVWLREETHLGWATRHALHALRHLRSLPKVVSPY